MKILFVSAWFPFPPDNGARIRTYNLIKALAADHEVFLVSLLQEESDAEDAAQLADICKIVSLHRSHWFRPGTLKSFLGYFSSKPRSVIDTYDPRVMASVLEAVRNIRPDVIIASTLGAVEYIPTGSGMPTLLDEHNCEYAILKRNSQSHAGLLHRMRYSAVWKKFDRYEATACRKFDKVVIVSERDRSLLLDAASDLEGVEVVPNGVDTDYYDPKSRRPLPGSLLYNGALTFGANLDAVRYFASDIYPLLGADVCLKVTGRHTGVDLSGIADCPGIELTGYVDDIRNVLAGSAACIVPLRQGGGSRLKILEAMAAGVPVISTSMGAEGIDAIHERHILIADSPADFANAIMRVLDDTSFACDLAANARRLVEEHYSWSSIGESFVKIVESIRTGMTACI